MRTRLLRLDGVSASFARGAGRVQVLREVSLELSAGELLAIYGRRGSGKTALLEVAAGLRAPDSGRVTFDGQDLYRLSRSALSRIHRDRIGWVDKAGPGTPEMQVGTYLAVSLYRSRGQRAAHLDATAMLDRVGVGEVVEARWADLSDSARSLVAIAHALVRQPALLVVDDPIYGLGADERTRVVGLLREVADRTGIAVLLAVPEMSAMLHAHTVRVLAGKKLVGPSPDDDNGTVVPLPGVC